MSDYPKRPYIRAELWWCGDEVCDCHQPRITIVNENPSDTRFNKYTTLWEGEFTCEGEITDNQINSLKEEASKRGITLDDHYYGVLEI